MAFFMEGDYSHYKTNDIENIFSYVKPIIDFLKKKLKENQLIIFNKIPYNETKDGVKTGVKNFVLHEDGTIYRTIPFEPNDDYLKQTQKEKMLRIEFILTKGIDANGVRKAYYSRKTSAIVLRIDLDSEAVMKYNILLKELPKNKFNPEKYIKMLDELTEMKKRIFYYIDPFLFKLVIVHEMTHWLDDVHDHQIYDLNTDTQSSWIDLESEQNAILHQLKYLKLRAKDKWLKLNLVDMLVMIRIRRDFIHQILKEYILNDKYNWIINFSKKMKDYNLLTPNTLSFDTDVYYKYHLVADQKVYRDYYIYLRGNVINN